MFTPSARVRASNFPLQSRWFQPNAVMGGMCFRVQLLTMEVLRQKLLSREHLRKIRPRAGVRCFPTCFTHVGLLQRPQSVMYWLTYLQKTQSKQSENDSWGIGTASGIGGREGKVDNLRRITHDAGCRFRGIIRHGQTDDAWCDARSIDNGWWGGEDPCAAVADGFLKSERSWGAPWATTSCWSGRIW